MKHMCRFAIVIALLSNLQACSLFCREKEVCYTESIPYNAIEEVKEPMKFEVVESKYGRRSECIERGFLGIGCIKERYYLHAWIQIKNVDKESGEFFVSETFDTYRDGIKTLTSEKKYITPGETVTFDFNYDLAGESAEYKEPSYHVYGPSITVQKEVTKYREEKRYRKCSSCDDNCQDGC